MTTYFHVGNNLAGYLPESEVTCFTDRGEAYAYLINHARDYADADDASVEDEYLTLRCERSAEECDCGIGTMSAELGAMLADGDIRDTGSDVVFYLTDHNDRRIAFFLSVDRSPEHDTYCPGPQD